MRKNWSHREPPFPFKLQLVYYGEHFLDVGEEFSLREFCVATFILIPGACGKGFRAAVDDTGSSSSGASPKTIGFTKQNFHFYQKTFKRIWFPMISESFC